MKVSQCSGSIFAAGNNSIDNQESRVHDEHRQSFVPHMPSYDTNVPNMSHLISMPERFYLQPIVDMPQYHQSKFTAHNKELEDISKLMHVNDKAPVLDLGTANLQRIVNNMKGLKFDADGGKVLKYSKDAARLNGLKSYTQYSGCPHVMNAWKSSHSLHKEHEKPPRLSSMYVGVGATHAGRQL